MTKCELSIAAPLPHTARIWYKTNTQEQISKSFKEQIFPDQAHILNYSMFHVTWTTFKFNRKQLETVSAYAM